METNKGYVGLYRDYRGYRDYRVYLDPGCPSFLGVMSRKFVGYTLKKLGHPGSRWYLPAPPLLVDSNP